MKAIQNLSIKYKLTLSLLVLTTFTLLLAGVVLYIYDLRLFREGLARDLTGLANVIGENSTAALSFNSDTDAQIILASLRNEPKVVGGRIYQKDAQGKFKEFASYTRPGAQPAFPTEPKTDGATFEPDRLVLFRSIKQDGSEKVLGSLFLEADLRAIRDRISVYTSELTMILALSALLGAALVSYLNRSIASPLRELARSAERIADGALAVQFTDTGRGDEVGLLARSFQRMTEVLRAQTHELVEGANLLAASSSEISASSSQLASSAAETATVVTETVATVREVKHTAEKAHELAQDVAESSQSALEISATGQRSTRDVLAAVERIRSQIESIAERTVHLSTQSQSIAEITSTVKDLAEQSNLLAVNAAIEAARAGEQGQAFAVVAHEVKSLAEQSKQATERVRTILTEVQKSIAAVVMVTEQGSKEAEVGVREARAAGDSIQQLAERVQTAASMGQQIAVSSREQSTGMDQVAAAMENIKIATTGNAGSSKQVETIARSLQQLGQRIKDITDHYKL